MGTPVEGHGTSQAEVDSPGSPEYQALSKTATWLEAKVLQALDRQHVSQVGSSTTTATIR